MKKYFHFVLLAIMWAFFLTNAEAQTRYGSSTFALDTLSATDAITYTLPSTYGSDNITEMVSWQVRVKHLADTLTYNIYYEESIDDANTSPVYAVVDTIKASGTAIASSDAVFLNHYALRGRRARLRITSTGSSAKAEVHVDAWVRNKVPYTRNN